MYPVKCKPTEAICVFIRIFLTKKTHTHTHLNTFTAATASEQSMGDFYVLMTDVDEHCYLFTFFFVFCWAY